jgi:dTMP kinase
VLVTFEGIDRAGKTTQARLLAEALGDEALLAREPGGTSEGERIRDLVKDVELDLSAIAETLLFGAARVELVEQVMRPALAAGKTVICDRYVDSTVAYQGGARGLGIDRVEELNRWITGGLMPDVTFLLEIEAGAAHARDTEVDRFEELGEEFQRAVAAANREDQDGIV